MMSPVGRRFHNRPSSGVRARPFAAHESARVEVNPVKLAYDPTLAGWLSKLIVSAFDWVTVLAILITGPTVA